MTDYRSEIDRLPDSLNDTATMASAFTVEMERMQASLAATGQDVVALERGLSSGLRKAFDGVVFDGMKLSDALKTVANSMINATYNAAIKPVTNHFGGLIAQGVSGLFGQAVPFSHGGIVNGPTNFPLRGGMGLMGEAGPEAIMPLTRGPDGRLGVRAAGGGGQTIVMNISTPDAASFQRSRGQIAAQMNRALGRGNRNM